MKFRLYIMIPLFLHLVMVRAQEMTVNEQLIDAAYQGDSITVQKLVRMGADVNTVTFERVTPLMFAAMNGYNPVVKYLLKQGAKPDMQAEDGNTALILAVASGQIETAETLLRNGANINLNDKQQVSPLMHAIEVDSFYLPDMMLYYGAEPAHKDLSGRNALMFASRFGSYEIAIKLLEAGLDVNEKDHDGNTSLHYATSSGKLDIMDLLIINGADLEIKNNSGYTPLAIAVSMENYKATFLLVGYGADVNTRITKSLNPLTLATYNKSDSIRKLLLVNDADLINRPNFDRFITGTTFTFNDNDSKIGILLGYNDSRFGLMPAVGYSIRPAAARILEKKDQATYYQYWERRHYVSIALDKAFITQKFSRNFKTSAYAGFSGVFTFGSYKGSSSSPDTRFLPVPRIGGFLQAGNIRLKFAYEFMNLRLETYNSNWYSVSLEFLLNTGRQKIQLP